MKQAFLITAYKDFDNLYELAEILCQNSYVYIHVDLKSRSITNADLEKLNALPGCVAVRSYRITWGSFSHVQAILNLLVLAIQNKDVSYLHLLTGEDFPLVNMEKLKEQFEEDFHIYMSYICPEDLPQTVTVRYRYYNWFVNWNLKNKVIWQLQYLSSKIQQRLKVSRNSIGEFKEIYKGLVYISLPRNVAAYVIEYVASHGKFWKDLRRCQLPEEFFFQTILMNSKFSKDVVNRELRYMNWEKGNGSGPIYLTLDDFQEVKESGCLFARKFHPVKSANLREKIKRELW